LPANRNSRPFPLRSCILTSKDADAKAEPYLYGLNH
jgi:hypothetical protein